MSESGSEFNRENRVTSDGDTRSEPSISSPSFPQKPSRAGAHSKLVNDINSILGTAFAPIITSATRELGGKDMGFDKKEFTVPGLEVKQREERKLGGSELERKRNDVLIYLRERGITQITPEALKILIEGRVIQQLPSKRDPNVFYPFVSLQFDVLSSYFSDLDLDTFKSFLESVADLREQFSTAKFDLQLSESFRQNMGDLFRALRLKELIPNLEEGVNVLEIGYGRRPMHEVLVDYIGEKLTRYIGLDKDKTSMSFDKRVRFRDYDLANGLPEDLEVVPNLIIINNPNMFMHARDGQNQLNSIWQTVFRDVRERYPQAVVLVTTMTDAEMEEVATVVGDANFSNSKNWYYTPVKQNLKYLGKDIPIEVAGISNFVGVIAPGLVPVDIGDHFRDYKLYGGQQGQYQLGDKRDPNKY